MASWTSICCMFSTWTVIIRQFGYKLNQLKLAHLSVYLDRVLLPHSICTSTHAIKVQHHNIIFACQCLQLQSLQFQLGYYTRMVITPSLIMKPTWMLVMIMSILITVNNSFLPESKEYVSNSKWTWSQPESAHVGFSRCVVTILEVDHYICVAKTDGPLMFQGLHSLSGHCIQSNCTTNFGCTKVMSSYNIIVYILVSIYQQRWLFASSCTTMWKRHDDDLIPALLLK